MFERLFVITADCVSKNENVENMILGCENNAPVWAHTGSKVIKCFKSIAIAKQYWISNKEHISANDVYIPGTVKISEITYITKEKID